MKKFLIFLVIVIFEGETPAQAYAICALVTLKFLLGLFFRAQKNTALQVLRSGADLVQIVFLLLLPFIHGKVGELDRGDESWLSQLPEEDLREIASSQAQLGYYAIFGQFLFTALNVLVFFLRVHLKVARLKQGRN